MHDIDFDGDLDLWVADFCGQNCDFKIYTNYKGNFSLNESASKIAFGYDFSFNKEDKTIEFIIHSSSSEVFIKYFQWNMSEINLVKEIKETRDSTIIKKLINGKWEQETILN